MNANVLIYSQIFIGKKYCTLKWFSWCKIMHRGRLFYAVSAELLVHRCSMMYQRYQRPTSPSQTMIRLVGPVYTLKIIWVCNNFYICPLDSWWTESSISHYLIALWNVFAKWRNCCHLEWHLHIHFPIQEWIITTQLKGRGTKSYKGYIAIFVRLSTKTVHLKFCGKRDTQQTFATFETS